MFQVPIIGNRLLLRDFVKRDARAITEIVRIEDPHFDSIAEGWPAATAEDSAKKFVHWSMNSGRTDPVTQIRDTFRLVITEVTDPKRPIGDVDLYVSGGRRYLGYMIDPRFQGNGYATEASVLLLNRFFASAPKETVYAAVEKDNAPSRKVLAKLGYKEMPARWNFARGIIDPIVYLSLNRQNFNRATKPARSKATDNNLVGALPCKAEPPFV